MEEARKIIRYLNEVYLKTFFLRILALSLVILGEFYICGYVISTIGLNLMLAMLSALSLSGCLVFTLICVRLIRKIHIITNREGFPQALIYKLAGSIFCGILFIVPGFGTSALALFLYFFGLHKLVGNYIFSRLHASVPDFEKYVYEYLRLYV